jgi:hypothetical protein
MMPWVEKMLSRGNKEPRMGLSPEKGKDISIKSCIKGSVKEGVLKTRVDRDDLGGKK